MALMSSTFPETYTEFMHRSPTFALGSSQSFAEYVQGAGPLQKQWQSRYDEVRVSAADQEFFMAYGKTLYLFLEMAPANAVAQVYAPVLAVICDLNLKVDLRLAVSRPDGLPVMQTLLGSEAHQPDTGCHVYVLDAEWQLAAHWTPLSRNGRRLPAFGQDDYAALRLRLNTARNRPICQEVRSGLEALLDPEPETLPAEQKETASA